MTKALVALVALAAVAAVATAVYVVLDNRDPVPGDVEACVREAGLSFAHSTGALTRARADAGAGELRVVRRWDWDPSRAVLLTGRAGDYALLALWNSSTPSLARADAGRRVHDAPERFPVVSLESPDRGRLRACADAA